MKQEFIAQQDCVIAGHGIVRAGARVALGRAQAKYPRLSGWIAPPSAETTAPRSPPKRARQPKRS